MRNTDRNHLVPGNPGAAQSDPAVTADASAPVTRRSAPSRRSVLAGAAGLAGAGLAGAGLAAGPVTAALASPRQAGRARPASAAHAAGADQPVVVHVRDVRSGDIELFAGTSQVRLRDEALAARLAQLARPAACAAR